MSEIDRRHVAKAKQAVRERFPGMSEVEPTVTARSVPHREGEVYVLIFRAEIPLPDGKEMEQIVRMTMDAGGEIIKLVSSR